MNDCFLCVTSGEPPKYKCSSPFHVLVKNYPVVIQAANLPAPVPVMVSPTGDYDGPWTDSGYVIEDGNNRLMIPGMYRLEFDCESIDGTEAPADVAEQIVLCKQVQEDYDCCAMQVELLDEIADAIGSLGSSGEGEAIDFAPVVDALSEQTQDLTVVIENTIAEQTTALTEALAAQTTALTDALTALQTALAEALAALQNADTTTVSYATWCDEQPDGSAVPFLREMVTIVSGETGDYTTAPTKDLTPDLQDYTITGEVKSCAHCDAVDAPNTGTVA